MWLAIAVLCLQTSATDIECHRDRRGPYLTMEECRGIARPWRETMLSVAAGVEAVIVFERVWCAKGNDV